MKKLLFLGLLAFSLRADLGEVIDTVKNIALELDSQLPAYEIVTCNSIGPVGICHLSNGYGMNVSSHVEELPKFLGRLLTHDSGKDGYLIHKKKCIFFDAVLFAEFIEKYGPIIEKFQPIQRWLPKKIQQQLKQLKKDAKRSKLILPHVDRVGYCIDAKGNISIALNRQVWRG